MKKYAAVLFTLSPMALASLPQTPPTFSAPKIETPAYGLVESSKRPTPTPAPQLKPALPLVRSRQDGRFVYKMPIIKPRDDIDYKLRIIVPDANIDPKMIIDSSESGLVHK